jgi:tetratricopeptide (TPR) repeat protein
LYYCDFRVRQHIAQCLIEPSTSYHHDDVDENFKINLALQKALCYHIGFGVPQDQVRVFEILSGIGRTKSDLDAIILPHMHWATRVATKDQDKYTLGMPVLQELGLRTIELGPYYIEDKNINEALEQLLKEKRAIENISGNQSPIWLILARSLADLYYSLGQWQEANELTKMCLEKSKEVFGEDHRQTLTFFSDLSTICREEQRWDEAEMLENKLRDISANVLGPEDPDTLTSISHLASIYRGQNRWEKAEEQEELLLEMRTRILGEEHPDTISTMSNLALTYDKRGRHTETEEQWKRVIRLSEKVLGQDHPQTLISKSSLGVMYHLHGKYEKAEGHFRDVWKWRKKILGTEHPSTLRTMYNLAGVIRDQGRWVEAENIYWQFIYAQLDGGNNTEAFDALEECIKMWMKEAGCEDEQMIEDGRAFRGYLKARPSFTQHWHDHDRA